MRTTAVYGNGKFGMCDFANLHDAPVLNAPFQAELLAVYMIRHFSDRPGRACGAHARTRKRPCPGAAATPLLGIGNATGLGMAPFLIKHPILIHKWLCARETALARVRGIDRRTAKRSRFSDLLDRAIAHVAEWNVEDSRQQDRIETLRSELAGLRVTWTIALTMYCPNNGPGITCSAGSKPGAAWKRRN